MGYGFWKWVEFAWLTTKLPTDKAFFFFKEKGAKKVVSCGFLTKNNSPFTVNNNICISRRVGHGSCQGKTICKMFDGSNLWMQL